MADIDMLSAAFSMLDEPVAVSRRNRIVYMNPAAVLLAGTDLTAKPLDTLMPAHITNNQADNFMTTAVVGGRSCTVKITTYNGLRVYVMTRSIHSVEPSEAVLSCLRSSMSNIRFSSLCISGIADETGNAKLKEYVCTLNRNYYRIKRTLDNFATLSGIAAGTIPFHPQPTDVTELCRSLVETVSVLTHPQDVKISFHAESNLRIVADRELLKQLILNLLSNSILFSRRGGWTTLSLLRTGSSLIICTDDDGVGIPPDELALVFERYKYSECLSRPSGAGIGLAVVRAIAELHKGALVLESRGVNAGTSVRVMLSYDIPPEKTLSAPELEYEDDNMQQILTELSTCLTLDCYSDSFED